MATQAEIKKRLEQAIENQRKLQTAIRAAAPSTEAAAELAEEAIPETS